MAQPRTTMTPHADYKEGHPGLKHTLSTPTPGHHVNAGNMTMTPATTAKAQQQRPALANISPAPNNAHQGAAPFMPKWSNNLNAQSAPSFLYTPPKYAGMDLGMPNLFLPQEQQHEQQQQQQQQQQPQQQSQNSAAPHEQRAAHNSNASDNMTTPLKNFDALQQFSIFDMNTSADVSGSSSMYSPLFVEDANPPSSSPFGKGDRSMLEPLKTNDLASQLLDVKPFAFGPNAQQGQQQQQQQAQRSEASTSAASFMDLAGISALSPFDTQSAFEDKATPLFAPSPHLSTQSGATSAPGSARIPDQATFDYDAHNGLVGLGLGMSQNQGAPGNVFDANQHVNSMVDAGLRMMGTPQNASTQQQHHNTQQRPLLSQTHAHAPQPNPRLDMSMGTPSPASHTPSLGRTGSFDPSFLSSSDDFMMAQYVNHQQQQHSHQHPIHQAAAQAQAVNFAKSQAQSQGHAHHHNPMTSFYRSPHEATAQHLNPNALSLPSLSPGHPSPAPISPASLSPNAFNLGTMPVSPGLAPHGSLSAGSAAGGTLGALSPGALSPNPLSPGALSPGALSPNPLSPNTLGASAFGTYGPLSMNVNPQQVAAGTHRCSQCRHELPLSAFPLRIASLTPYLVCKAHGWYWTDAKKKGWAPEKLSTLPELVSDIYNRRDVTTWMLQGCESDRKNIVDNICAAGNWNAENLPARRSRATCMPAPPPSYTYRLTDKRIPKDMDPAGLADKSKTLSRLATGPRYRLRIIYHAAFLRFTVILTPEGSGGGRVSPNRKRSLKDDDESDFDDESDEASPTKALALKAGKSPKMDAI